MSPSRRPPSTRRASERSAIEREQAAQLQTATYRISEAAHAAEDLAQLFRAVHDIISELMPAKNLYIALYDAHAGLLSFPYWVDEHDPPPARHKLERGLTEYVLRTGQPLLATPEVHEELSRRGEADLVGAPSLDWIGVPLKAHDRTIGVLVAQTYTEGIRFGEREKEILQFVSTQVAMAIERKRAQEAVRTSEARLKALLDSALDACVTMDETGRIMSWSAAAETVFGWPVSEAIGRSLADTIIPSHHREGHARRGDRVREAPTDGLRHGPAEHGLGHDHPVAPPGGARAWPRAVPRDGGRADPAATHRDHRLAPGRTRVPGRADGDPHPAERSLAIRGLRPRPHRREACGAGAAKGGGRARGSGTASAAGDRRRPEPRVCKGPGREIRARQQGGRRHLRHDGGGAGGQDRRRLQSQQGGSGALPARRPGGDGQPRAESRDGRVRYQPRYGCDALVSDGQGAPALFRRRGPPRAWRRHRYHRAQARRGGAAAFGGELSRPRRARRVRYLSSDGGRHFPHGEPGPVHDAWLPIGGRAVENRCQPGRVREPRSERPDPRALRAVRLRQRRGGLEAAGRQRHHGAPERSPGARLGRGDRVLRVHRRRRHRAARPGGAAAPDAENG